jgi:3'-5' exoribonuclease
MKSPYVSELQPNQQATGVFLVHAKEVRQKKSGDLYLSLLVGDRTGEVDAKMWDNISEWSTPSNATISSGLRRPQRFSEPPAVHYHKLQRVDEAEIDIEDSSPGRRAIWTRCSRSFWAWSRRSRILTCGAARSRLPR